MPLIQHIAQEGFLADSAIRDAVAEGCAALPADGKRVLFLVPDGTRSMPMPVVFRALCDNLNDRAAQVDFLIALGTHQPMSEEAIRAHFGLSAQEQTETYGAVNIFNHAWQDPGALACIGSISEDEIEAISEGRMRQSVDVHLNKRVLDYDLVCVVGPVFPHEVVGFSGGNKYFFPGVAGPEILNLFHWLGALITNYAINGTKNTPVREVVNKAADFIPVEKHCFSFTVVGKDTKAVFFGSPEEAWSAAADLSAEVHIITKEKPFKQVLAMAPKMYDDIWVAGKCMYKLEPVIADGGELIIYAPHVTEVSYTHGDQIREIGYHTRDYFTAQMDKFTHIPGGILAHSTHVRGRGTYENGVEKCRVKVTLATGIPEEACHAISLAYRDPASINPADFANREDEGILLVERAGEILYHLRGHG